MATKKQFVVSKKIQSTLEFNVKTLKQQQLLLLLLFFKSTVGDRDFKQLHYFTLGLKRFFFLTLIVGVGSSGPKSSLSMLHKHSHILFLSIPRIFIQHCMS